MREEGAVEAHLRDMSESTWLWYQDFKVDVPRHI